LPLLQPQDDQAVPVLPVLELRVQGGDMKYWLFLPFILLVELVQLPYRIMFWIDKLIRRVVCRMKIGY